MLILGDGDEPFFGSIAVGLNLIEDNFCPTAATDGINFVYNKSWIETLTIEELMTLFEHEVYHVALKHPALMRSVWEEEGPHFDNSCWQKACDIPINNRLIQKGRKMPTTLDGYQPQFDDEYEGWSSIRIYQDLKKKKQKSDGKKGGQCDGDGLKGDPGKGKSGKSRISSGNDNAEKNKNNAKEDKDDGSEPSEKKSVQPKDMVEDTGGFGGVDMLKDQKTGELATSEQIKQFEKDFEMKIANASRVLQKELEVDIGDLPEFIQEIIEAHTEPQRTYKDLITDVLDEITRDDYNWGKRNRKYDDIYLPSLFENEAKTVAVIVDTSGSISKKELETYASELTGIVSEFEDIEVFVIFHNTVAYHTKTYTIEDLPIKFDKTQSGGTDYKDAYRKVEEAEDYPLAIFHFTDLEVSPVSGYPRIIPEAQVFWMYTSYRKSPYSIPPFGQIVQLEINK